MLRNRLACVTAVLAGTMGFGLASASAAISDVVIRIEASNSLGTAVYEGSVGQGSWQDGGVFRWNSTGPINLMSSDGQIIATFNGGNVRIIEDPVIQLNFSVSAGSLDTTFTISSPLLMFPTIAEAEGRASAGVSVTDTNGDGATLSPHMQPGLYMAHYNGLAPTGTLFSDLLTNPVVAGAFDTASASDSSPGGGAFSPIGVPLNDQSARFRFTLSANDQASGTSTYETRPIPAPGAVALLGIAGLVARRRRRN